MIKQFSVKILPLNGSPTKTVYLICQKMPQQFMKMSKIDKLGLVIMKKQWTEVWL